MGVIGLDNILVVTFFEAIKKNNPAIIDKSLSYDKFEELVQEYMILQKGDLNTNEQRILKLRAKITLVSACLVYLEDRPFDDEVMQVLRDQKMHIEKDTYPMDMVKIMDKLDALNRKLEVLEGSDPLLQYKRNKKYDGKGEWSIYDTLASMSASLDGLYLNPRDITVREFLAYQNVIRNKNESVSKMNSRGNNKLNGNSNGIRR